LQRAQHRGTNEQCNSPVKGSAVNEEALHNDIDLQRILWACYDYWQREGGSPAERMVCHYWVVDPYRDRFGGTFSQNRLRQLARLGFLQQLYAVRGGSRRYYALVNPDRIAELLAGCGIISSPAPIA
jgi:hypothetical protein